MKVLGIVGSGRKEGNTDTLVDKILEGARSSGHDTSKVSLTDVKISPIGDCRSCREAGHCLIEDDSDALRQQMLAGDCVVFGTPLYWYGPSAQMKAFLDRWVCPMNLDKHDFLNRMRGKKCLLAVPHQDTRLSGAEHLFGTMEKTFEFL